MRDFAGWLCRVFVACLLVLACVWLLGIEGVGPWVEPEPEPELPEWYERGERPSQWRP